MIYVLMDMMMLGNMFFFVVVKRNQRKGMYGVPKCSIQFQLVFWRIWQNSLIQQVVFCFHRDKTGEEKPGKRQQVVAKKTTGKGCWC